MTRTAGTGTPGAGRWPCCDLGTPAANPGIKDPIMMPTVLACYLVCYFIPSQWRSPFKLDHLIRFCFQGEISACALQMPSAVAGVTVSSMPPPFMTSKHYSALSCYILRTSFKTKKQLCIFAVCVSQAAAV